MLKTVFLVDTALRHPEVEWIAWMDDDTWINPRWFDLPLERFLDDVPKDKVYVQDFELQGVLQAGVYFLRNNAAGRRLAMDWLAIDMRYVSVFVFTHPAHPVCAAVCAIFSGHIQCHGFDQGAIAMLFLNRLNGNMDDPNPYGYTCLYKDDNAWEGGCNSGPHWSCDWIVEKVLMEVGFTASSSSFFQQKFSSYSKGCANDVVPEFHVLTETAELPRYQILHGLDLDTMNSGEDWHGPMGAGNSPLFQNSQKNWFLNHKGQWLFYSSYLNASQCTKVDFKFPPDCEPADESLLSLTDGLAFSVQGEHFCEVNEQAKKLQETETYMADFEDIISRVKSIPEAEWDRRTFPVSTIPMMEKFKPPMFESIDDYCNAACKPGFNTTVNLKLKSCGDNPCDPNPDIGCGPPPGDFPKPPAISLGYKQCMNWVGSPWYACEEDGPETRPEPSSITSDSPLWMRKQAYTAQCKNINEGRC